ncbi:serine/threonine protein kinase [Mycobacterium sp. HUMS_1102779]|uniref:serine/threonine protein kinase n=1 Tax=Mycobacterium sp. HUMS_1102779 TaxID=3383487 RepID=UPI00389A3C2B
MSHSSNALRVASLTVLAGSLAFTGAAPAAADPNTGNQSDIDTLSNALSKGYDLKVCAPQPIAPGQLASLQCGQSPDPDGPAEAKYILFSNGNDLGNMFSTSIKEETLANCGNEKSPTKWHQGSSATSNAGQVACGTFQNAAEVIWTVDAKNVLSYIRASNNDVPALYEWWRNNG